MYINCNTKRVLTVQTVGPAFQVASNLAWFQALHPRNVGEALLSMASPFAKTFVNHFVQNVRESARARARARQSQSPITGADPVIGWEAVAPTVHRPSFAQRCEERMWLKRQALIDAGEAAGQLDYAMIAEMARAALLIRECLG